MDLLLEIKIGFQDTECAPDIFSFADGLEGGNFWAIQSAENGGIHGHCEAVDAVLGEEDEVGKGVGALCLPY